MGQDFRRRHRGHGQGKARGALEATLGACVPPCRTGGRSLARLAPLLCGVRGRGRERAPGLVACATSWSAAIQPSVRSASVVRSAEDRPSHRAVEVLGDVVGSEPQIRRRPSPWRRWRSWGSIGGSRRRRNVTSFRR